MILSFILFIFFFFSFILSSFILSFSYTFVCFRMRHLRRIITIVLSFGINSCVSMPYKHKMKDGVRNFSEWSWKSFMKVWNILHLAERSYRKIERSYMSSFILSSIWKKIFHTFTLSYFRKHEILTYFQVLKVQIFHTFMWQMLSSFHLSWKILVVSTGKTWKKFFQGR
jgi:hypothetical protein